MNWLFLTESSQLESIVQSSYSQDVIIYKHSTRCGVSLMSKRHLESSFTNSRHNDLYYLDLLSYRPVSNAVAERFMIPHKSPQVLLIRKGECIYSASHSGIEAAELSAQLI